VCAKSVHVGKGARGHQSMRARARRGQMRVGTGQAMHIRRHSRGSRVVPVDSIWTSQMSMGGSGEGVRPCMGHIWTVVVREASGGVSQTNFPCTR